VNSLKSNPYKRKKYKHSHSPMSVGIPQKKKFWAKFRRKEPSIYLDTYKKNNRLPLLIPSVIIATLLILVFWTGPMLLGVVSNLFLNRNDGESTVLLLYESQDYAVAKRQVVDVFYEPDLRSKRMTQLLYNDVTEITSRDYYGFLEIRLAEGVKGYVMEKDVTFCTSHVEPALFRHKIVITAKSKRIMSHASRGSLLVEVPMGTVLFSDYQGSNVYRIALADDDYGWISASGMIRLDPEGSPQKSTAEKYYETVLHFNHAKYIEGGISTVGASSEGIAFISAYINGLDIPRDRYGQMEAGYAVSAFKGDLKTLDYALIQRGDLIFFGEKTETEIRISEMGIVVGYGQVLMSRRTQSSVRIIRLDDHPSLAEYVITVRRLF
jgi:hypothetical protein